MRPVKLVAVLATLLLQVSSMHAQDGTAPLSGPRKGSWAAEGGLASGISLLNFRSTSSAWVIGLAGSYTRQDVESSDPLFDPGERTTFSGDVRLGLRWYGRDGQQLRPFHTAAALIGLNSSGSGARVSLGASGESGAHWFFSPNLSMGTGARLSLYRYGYRQDFGGSSLQVTNLGVTLQLLFLGALYF